MKITAYVASAFSKNHEGGNKAGVVFMTQPLTRTQKMALAKELGFAETAFISDSKIADFRLEYFTPKEEVDLCGHATIGAFTIMKHLNKLLQTAYTIETNSGLLAITANGEQLFMEQTVPTFYDTLTLEELSGCFDLNAVATAFPIQIWFPLKMRNYYRIYNQTLKKLSYLVKSMELSGCIFLLCLKKISFVGILHPFMISMKKPLLVHQMVR